VKLSQQPEHKGNLHNRNSSETDPGQRFSNPRTGAPIICEPKLEFNGPRGDDVPVAQDNLLRGPVINGNQGLRPAAENKTSCGIEIYLKMPVPHTLLLHYEVRPGVAADTEGESIGLPAGTRAFAGKNRQPDGHSD